MRSLYNLLVFPASIVLGGIFSGCAIVPMAETSALKCGETKVATFNLPTKKDPHVVGVEFTLACKGDARGIELSLKDHPWGGFGKTLPRTIGNRAPDYEYIPCADNADLKAKWDDLNHLEHFSHLGRVIDNIRDVKIEKRFPNDYDLRFYVLRSAEKLCSAAPS